MATKQEFGKFMLHLQTALPKFAPDVSKQETIDVWYDALKSIELDGLREIYKYCRDNLDQFPSIKFLKELVAFGSDEIPTDPFSDIIAAVQSRNFDRHPAILELARQLGGWQIIGDWNIEHYDHKRRMVDNMWKSVLQRWLIGNQWEEKEDYNALPPANVLAVIAAGAAEAVPDKKDNSKISIRHWIDDVRKIQVKTNQEYLPK